MPRNSKHLKDKEGKPLVLPDHEQQEIEIQDVTIEGDHADVVIKGKGQPQRLHIPLKLFDGDQIPAITMIERMIRNEDREARARAWRGMRYKF